MKYLPLACTPFDTLLGGGIEQGVVTKVFGEAGTGKTNVCLQAARECAKHEGSVAYIDSEGVSIERLRQICTKDYNKDKTLDRILFFSPTTFEEQENMINEAIKIQDIKLIIVDTINLFYRITLEEDMERTKRSFVRQVARLQVAARNKDLFVLITEQVYTDKNGEIKPFTHRDTEHMAKTIVRLEKVDIGKRLATIVKHRSEPEGKNTHFTITRAGLK
jgi:DNA repair protein RadB